MIDDLAIDDELSIAASEFQFTFARSSGPGGQNVNKLTTKVVLRWSPVQSPSLPAEIRRRFLAAYRSRLTSLGELVLHCDTHRLQSRNRRECLERLGAMIRAVRHAPKRRRQSKPTRGSIERRLSDKRKRSEKKSSRRPTESS